jgi:uncharacterized membrane protein (UPF0127 family)
MFVKYGLFLVLFIILGLLQPLESTTTPLPSFEKAQEKPIEITVTTPNGNKIYAELADTPRKRARGLMFREHLDKDRGMLFTFPDSQPWTIWMKNTKIPLDLIWLNRKKTIIHIEPNVPGCRSAGNDCQQYQPNSPAFFVLELSAGTAERLHLKKGTPLTFSEFPAGS